MEKWEIRKLERKAEAEARGMTVGELMKAEIKEREENWEIFITAFTLAMLLIFFLQASIWIGKWLMDMGLI